MIVVGLWFRLFCLMSKSIKMKSKSKKPKKQKFSSVKSLLKAYR